MYDKNTWRIFSSLHARSRYAATIDRHGEPMERRLIQFAFPGKEEGNRSRKIIFQGGKKKRKKKESCIRNRIEFIPCVPIKASKSQVQSTKLQSSRKEKRLWLQLTGLRSKTGTRFFPRCFREIGLKRVSFYYPRRTEIIVS